MDWNRARAILLVTFTVINLGLAYLLFGPGFTASAPGFTDRWQLREVRAQLAAQGLQLVADLPRQDARLPFLRIAAPAPATTQQLIALFNRILVERGPGRVVGTVTARDDGTVAFLAGAPMGSRIRMESHSAVRDAADAFLFQVGLFEVADLRWARTYDRGSGRALVEYVPYYGGRPVFAGSVAVGVTSGGIHDVTVFLPLVEGFRGEPRAVLPAAEASLRLAGHVRAMRLERAAAAAPATQRPAVPGPMMPFQPVLDDPRYLTPREEMPAAPRVPDELKLVQVELGYFATPTPGARSWDTVPVWRFVTETAGVFYVNAFTGELEGSS